MRQLEHQLANLPDGSAEGELIERAISHLYGPVEDLFPDLSEPIIPQRRRRPSVRPKGRPHRQS
jgi:hypothetical protein